MKTTKNKRESTAAASRRGGAGKKASAGKPQTAPIIVLASNCAVKDAAALKESLCAVLDENAAVTLDVRGLERVDTAAVQLLCAFVRDRSARDQQVLWLGESQALQEAARLLGIGDLLRLSQTANESDTQTTGAAA